MKRPEMVELAKNKPTEPITDFPELVKDAELVVGDLEQLLKSSTVAEAVSLLLACDRWMSRRNDAATPQYQLGQVVTVSLGPGCYKPETDGDHPAVILYDEPNWALIAPVTSKKKPDGETLLPIYLGQPDTIMLKQIRSISKSRIIGPWRDENGGLVVIDVEPIYEKIVERFLTPKKDSGPAKSNNLPSH